MTNKTRDKRIGHLNEWPELDIQSYPYHRLQSRIGLGDGYFCVLTSGINPDKRNELVAELKGVIARHPVTPKRKVKDTDES